MTPAEVIEKAETIRILSATLRQLAINGDVELVEETARVLEGIAGGIIAEMQTEGLGAS